MYYFTDFPRPKMPGQTKRVRFTWIFDRVDVGPKAPEIVVTQRRSGADSMIRMEAENCMEKRNDIQVFFFFLNFFYFFFFNLLLFFFFFLFVYFFLFFFFFFFFFVFNLFFSFPLYLSFLFYHISQFSPIHPPLLSFLFFFSKFLFKVWVEESEVSSYSLNILEDSSSKRSFSEFSNQNFSAQNTKRKR